MSTTMTSALLALCLAQTWYTPEEAQTLFAQANDAYYQQDFAKAIEGYQALLDKGAGGPDLLFNLGTAYLAQGNLGLAVVNLERARKLSRDDDIEANLATARTRQIDQVVGAAGSEPFIERLVGSTDEALFAWPLVGALWALLGSAFFLRRAASKVVPALALAACAGVVLVSGAGFAAHVYVARTVRDAVIVVDTARVREAPVESARSAFELHAGLKVRIAEESGKFTRVRLPNGLEGWVERSNVVDL